MQVFSPLSISSFFSSEARQNVRAARITFETPTKLTSELIGSVYTCNQNKFTNIKFYK
jgi:hypothetical protein